MIWLIRQCHALAVCDGLAMQILNLPARPASGDDAIVSGFENLTR